MTKMGDQATANQATTWIMVKWSKTVAMMMKVKNNGWNGGRYS